MTKLNRNIKDNYRDSFEHIILNQGGEVEGFSNFVKHHKFICSGCEKKQKIDSLHGYTHSFRGLRDKNGQKWWVYYRCPCGYRTSWEKLRGTLSP